MSAPYSPRSRIRGSTSAEVAIAQALSDGIRPDPLLTVSEWADANRVLSPKAASEPGRWRTSRTPYLREIMDELSTISPTQRVVFMKAAQIGGTEAGNNWIGYVIDHAPGPMLAVQPTVELAKRNSRQRIAPLIEDTPSIRARVRDPRSRDSGNTILAKEFEGGVLVMTGANSAVGLRSMPARYLFLDEIDAYDGDVEGEGDPIALAEARTRTFNRRKVFMVSTPKVQGRSRIEREYEASDKRRYFCPCPECGHYQTLEFKQLRWPKGEPRKAVYVCEECGSALGEQHKTEMLARGEWRATAPGEDKAAGFHLSSLYSPVGWLSWVEIAQKWEAAQSSPDLLKEFINTTLGETWVERGDAPDWQRLYDRREEYRIGQVPMGGLFLTAGTDVHPDRLETSIWAWGRGKESWLVEHRVLMGDTARPEVWEQLTGLLGETWTHESGVEMSLMRLAIDSGFSTAEVYAWARSQSAGRVMVVKGKDRAPAMVGHVSTVDFTSSGRKIRRGAKVWPVGVSIIKLEFYGWLRLDRPTDEAAEQGETCPPGYVHLPKVDAEFCKQMTAEQLVTRSVRGYRRTEWVKTRERNEALDCRVYARAAAHLVGIDRFGERHWRGFEDALGVAPERPDATAQEAEPQEQVQTPPSPAAAAWPGRGRQGGWVSGGRPGGWIGGGRR